MTASYKSKAAAIAMRRDECRLWTIRGGRGYVSTWGDGLTWMLAVDLVTPRRWEFIKQRMAASPVWRKSPRTATTKACFD